jgi:hypothetical protein
MGTGEDAPGQAVVIMKTPLFLPVASNVTLIFAAGHTMGGMQSWSPAGNTDVLKAMRSFRFDAEGVSRTYWDLYIGFGLIISVFLFVQAVLLWQLAVLSKNHATEVRPIVALLLFAMLINAALSWKFFFAVPVILGSVIAASLALALVSAKRTPVV